MCTSTTNLTLSGPTDSVPDGVLVPFDTHRTEDPTGL